MVKRITPGILLVFCATAATVRAEDFTIRLGLKNAHLREVFFGCAAGATSGYDRRIDDFAPPPGIETGYVGFVSGDKRLPLFYKDIHGMEPEQTWTFHTRVFEGKPIEISWVPESLPAGWTFTLTSKAGELDMSRKSSIEIPESEKLVFKARKAEQKPGKNGPETKTE